MNYCKKLALLLLLYSIGHLPQRLTAASTEEKPGEANNTTPALVQQTSPSPSPSAGNSNLDVGNSKIDVKTPTGQETCDGLNSNKCHEGVMNVTACVLPGDGPMGLLVLNAGNGSLKFNVTILPSKPSYDNIEVPGHEVRRINVSASASSNSSIVLKAVNWNCTIHLDVHDPVPVPVGFSFPSYAAYVTPINGAYVLSATAFLIGLMWACCKLGRNKRQLDGIPYQELEMGQQQSTPSISVETAANWDQDWDDDWDEEKAVRSPSESRIKGNRRANGGSSRFAESNGWEDD